MNNEDFMDNEEARLSFAGIAFGAIAFIVALVHFWAGPFSSQPALEQTVAERAVAIRDSTIAALRGDEVESVQEPAEFTLDRGIEMAVPIFGGIAIILGVVGFALKEPLRVAGGAAFLGACGIAFQFAALALGAIVLAILVAAVLSQLGFG